MPEFLGYPVRTTDDWERIKAERLDPAAPGRLAVDWDAYRGRLRQTGEAVQVGWFPSPDFERANGHLAAELAPDIKLHHLTTADDSQRAAYAAADIFLSLTDNVQESFGLTPIEAMACGLPVIATDWSGPTEFLTQRNGYPLAIEGLVRSCETDRKDEALPGAACPPQPEPPGPSHPVVRRGRTPAFCDGTQTLHGGYRVAGGPVA